MRLALIPAKGGSVRLPGKNVKLFHGKPLLQYSVEVARASGLFDRVVVSTDDAKIAELAETMGAIAMMRPKSLAQVGTQELAAYVLRQGQMPDYACVIYATAPMLEPEDLREGWRALVRGRTFAFAVGTEPLRDAGMFYFGRAWAFLDGVPLIGPDSALIPIPEARCIDINTAEDFSVAESMYAKLHPIQALAHA